MGFMCRLSQTNRTAEGQLSAEARTAPFWQEFPARWLHDLHLQQRHTALPAQDLSADGLFRRPAGASVWGVLSLLSSQALTGQGRTIHVLQGWRSNLPGLLPSSLFVILLLLCVKFLFITIQPMHNYSYTDMILIYLQKNWNKDLMKIPFLDFVFT